MRVRPRERGWWWKGPLLAVTTTLIMLGGIEAASHLFGEFHGPRQSLQVGAIQLYGRHDPLLFWSLDPGARDAAGQRWINDRGLRGPEVGEKLPGEYRVLSLGESTTFAAQVPYEECYSAVLEELLSRRGDGRRVRVLNGGVPGYSLFQGVTYLRERSAALEPDMVLLYFGYNDFLPVAHLANRIDNAAETDLGQNDWEIYEHRRLPSQRVLAFLMRHSNLVRGLRERRTLDPEDLRLDTNRPRVPAEHRESLLKLAKEYADEHRIELVLVVPIYPQFELHAPLLRQFAEAHAVALVDLPALLGERFGSDPALYFSDTFHPSREGHRHIAEAIRDVIAPRVPR